MSNYTLELQLAHEGPPPFSFPSTHAPLPIPIRILPGISSPLSPYAAEPPRRLVQFLRRFFPTPWHRASADVAAGEPLQYGAILEAVGRAANFFTVDGELRDLTEFVFEEVRRSIPEGGLPENSVLSLCFSVRTVFQVGLVAVPVEREGVAAGMVPAADSAFGLLEKYEEEEEEEEERCCSICWEKLGGGGGGGGAVRMPCAHVFHGGCINRWLRKSHYCPLCRYQMPT